MTLHKGFGTVLRDARVSQGLSYSTVSRKLKIRPDILEAIENQDFSKMPPKSYSRGMINAYATLLHLNPEALCSDYLEREAANGAGDVYAGSGSSRENRRTSGNNRSGNQRHSRSASSRSDTHSSGFTEDSDDFAVHTRDSYRRSDRSSGVTSLPETRYRESSARSNSGHRSSAPITPEITYDAQSHSGRLSSRGDRGPSRSSRKPVQPADLSASRGLSFRKSHVDINHSIYADRKGSGRKRVGSMGLNSSYLSGGNMVGSFNGTTSGGSSKKFIILAALVIIIILVILVNVIGGLISGGSSSSNTSSSSSMTISGLNDPGTSSTSVVQETPKVVAVAPSATVVSYEVKQDNEAYIEIYLNDSGYADVADTLSGGSKGSYDVTGTLEFVTSNPDGVTLKQDGTTIELTDDDGDGVYIYTVNFQDVLAAWKAANGQS